MAKDEPQSYGSGPDWVSGKTGQEVNRQKGVPDENRRDAETSAPDQGGQISDVQLSENAQPTGRASSDEQPTSRVTDQAGGAKRGGFFKKRDYS